MHLEKPQWNRCQFPAIKDLCVQTGDFVEQGLRAGFGLGIEAFTAAWENGDTDHINLPWLAPGFQLEKRMWVIDMASVLLRGRSHMA